MFLFCFLTKKYTILVMSKNTKKNLSRFAIQFAGGTALATVEHRQITINPLPLIKGKQSQNLDFLFY